MLPKVCLMCAVLLLHIAAPTNSNSTEAESEVNFCLADKPEISLEEEDYVGEMYVYQYPCDMPTQFQSLSSNGEGFHYFPIGSRVQLRCDTLTDGRCFSKSTFLADTGLLVTKEFLNDHQTLFTLDFLAPKKEEYLACHCNGSVTGLFKPIIRFSVGEKPEPVQGFSCIVWDFQYAECAWTNQEAENIEWTACYKQENGNFQDSDSIECSAPTPLTTFTIDDYSYRGEYTIYLNGRNDFGVINTTVNYTLTTERLHPPNINLTEHVESTAVTIRWKHQCGSNLLYRSFCLSSGLLYKITVSVDEETTPDVHYIKEADRVLIKNGLFQPTNYTIQNDTNIVVNGLLPATNYILKMEQKISGTEDWSLAAVDTFQTAEQIADNGPVIQPNGFSVEESGCNSTEQRKVTVYWEGLQVHNGGNGIPESYSIFNETKSAAFKQMTLCVGKSTTSLLIYVHNSQGKGRLPSTLIIPREERIIELASCLVRARRDRQDRNSVFVNWRLMSEHLHLHYESADVVYTVFWCKFTNGTCQDELRWQDVPIATKEAELKLPENLDPSLYRYGVAVQVDDYRSGVVWADCLLGPVVTDNIGLEYSVKTYNATHAKVRIEPQCIDEIGMIESIELFYCRQQDSSCKSEKSIANFCGKVSYIQLDPRTEYSLWLNVSYPENIVVKEYKPKNFTLSYNTGVEQNITVILLVVMAAVISVIAAAIACYARRKCRNMRKMRITTIKPTLIAEHNLVRNFTDDDNSAPYECWSTRADDTATIELLPVAKTAHPVHIQCHTMTIPELPEDREVVKCTLNAQLTDSNALVNSNSFSQGPENHDSDYCTDMSSDSVLDHHSQLYDQSALESFNRKLGNNSDGSFQQRHAKQQLHSGYVRVDPQPLQARNEPGSLSDLYNVDISFFAE